MIYLKTQTRTNFLRLMIVALVLVLGVAAIGAGTVQAAQVTIDFEGVACSGCVVDFTSGDEDGFHLVAAPAGKVSNFHPDGALFRAVQTGETTLTLTELDSSTFTFQSVDLQYVGDPYNPTTVTAHGYLGADLVARDEWAVPRSFDLSTYDAVNLAGRVVDRLVFTLSADEGNAWVSYLDDIVLEPDPPPGRIIVVKQTDPGGTGDFFDFNTSYGDSFYLQDGQSNDSGDLEAGTYWVSEETYSGEMWRLLSATCDNGSDPSSIDLRAGETVTCTFVNQMNGNITVKKVIDPYDDLSGTVFDFTTSYGSGAFSLVAEETNDSGWLVPGTYSVSEQVPDGWDLTSATCDDGSDPSNIELEAGEYVWCTFVNHTDTPVYYNRLEVVKTCLEDPGQSHTKPIAP